MSYVDLAALVDRFGTAELRQLAPAGAEGIDERRVERACTDAGDIADGYLRTRYALPLADVPPLLARLVAAIARYELHLGEDRQPTEQVIRERDAALAMLGRIAKGDVDLGLPTGEEPAEDATGIVTATGEPRNITTGDLAEYRLGWRA